MKYQSYVNKALGVTLTLHRLHADKKEVIVYDYTDDAVPMLAAMFGRRLKGYEAAGYSVEDELPLSSYSEKQA